MEHITIYHMIAALIAVLIIAILHAFLLSHLLKKKPLLS